MSWLSRLGKSAKKLVTHPADWAKSVGHQAGHAFEQIDDIALPAAGFLIGGPAGAAVGGALSKGVGNGRPDLGSIVKGAASGYAGGTLAGGIPGLGGLAGKFTIPGIAGPTSQSLPAIIGQGGAGAATAPGGGGISGALQSILGAAGGYLKDPGNLAKILGTAVTGVGAYQGYQAAKDANHQQSALLGRQMALGDETAAAGRGLLTDTAPLRQEAQAKLRAALARGVPRQPDVSRVTNTRNPFARQFARPMVRPPTAVGVG